MNLREYQTASRATAIYPRERALEYCVLGLISEVGELAGKLKKAIRDGTPEDVLREQMLDELGDICWYVASCATEMGYVLAGETKVIAARMPAYLVRELAYLAYCVSESSDRISDATDDIGMNLELVAGHVSFFATTYGSSLEAVLGRNIAKLADRQARGVLKGEGDLR